jgi:phage FluMu gp28-like protein
LSSWPTFLQQQEQALFFICDPTAPRRYQARWPGNGNYLAEQAAEKYGAEVEVVMPSVAHYRENMPRFKAAFEDDELVLPKHEDVISDLGRLSFSAGAGY